MAITIEEINSLNQHDLNRCDNAFVVDSKVVLHAADSLLSYTIVSVPPYVKQYPRGATETERYLALEQRGIFFAYVEGKLAGQIVLFPYLRFSQ